jgi:hypothetical protein
MIGRRDRIALGAGLAFAIAMPAILLPSGTIAEAPPPAAPQPPLSAPLQPTLAAAFVRPLFAGTGAEAKPQDAPALVGIVGRLDQDAVAMVQTSDGATRTLHIGESVDGWRLASLAIDAASFTRGSEQVRVALPSADEPPPSASELQPGQ